MEADFRARAVLKRKGLMYEDFVPGRRFKHHWGRTLNEGDNSLFSTLTLHFNPLYFNVEYAKVHGHPQVVINPYLVFTTVFGLTVEDFSEAGGAFLGLEDLRFEQPVYAGDTLRAESEVVSRRESEKNPGQGIVTWSTQGFNQRDEQVVAFKRTNLVNLRSAAR
jgi:acyl dehydratase